MFEYKAIVRKVYDGDTIRADVDLGFGMWVMNKSFRLYGINAPEVRGVSIQEGYKSRDWLREQIPLGSEIIIKTKKDKQGKYGRYLVVLYLDDRNLNEEMINLGLAKKYG